jgi:hypothetical protein
LSPAGTAEGGLRRGPFSAYSGGKSGPQRPKPISFCFIMYGLKPVPCTPQRFSAVCLAPEGMRGPPQLILNALKMDSTIETLHYVRQVAHQITK